MAQPSLPTTIFHDQHGGVGFNTLWVCFVILFLTPFFWDVASVHYTRRFAGTGADAAALAAAQDYAGRLQHTITKNDLFRGICGVEETPQQVVERYLLDPAFFDWGGSIGRSSAETFALANGDTLTSYNVMTDYSRAKLAAGIPVPAIRIDVAVQRSVATAYRRLYGRSFEVMNRARSVASLSEAIPLPQPCGPEIPPTYNFIFKWKITLESTES